MSKVKDGDVIDEDYYANESDPVHIAVRKTADPRLVKMVLASTEEDDDGRSQWVWLRLRNGDLVLAVYPQGDTYCVCEGDAP